MSIRVDLIHVALDAYIEGTLTGRQTIKFDYVPTGQDDPIVLALIGAWRAQYQAELANSPPADPTVVI